MEKTTQWRFTPPTHVVVALQAALEQYAGEGGQPARLARYARNCEVLVKGMTLRTESSNIPFYAGRRSAIADRARSSLPAKPPPLLIVIKLCLA